MPRRLRRGSGYRLTALVLVMMGLLAGVGLDFVLPSSAQQPPPFVQRKFYLTRTSTFDGAQALNACAPGYHMAALWEVIDPSNLVYDAARGFVLPDEPIPNDQLSSVPAGEDGWIRTSGRGDSSTNCRGWTSNSDAHNGNVVQLPDDTVDARGWDDAAQAVSPWRPARANCVNENRVWCIQN